MGRCQLDPLSQPDVDRVHDYHQTLFILGFSDVGCEPKSIHYGITVSLAPATWILLTKLGGLAKIIGAFE